MRKLGFQAALSLLAVLALSSWARAQDEAGPPRDPVAAEIERTLPSDGRLAGEALMVPASLRRFYERRGFAPAWDKPGGRDSRGLREAIAGAEGHGLAPDSYHLQAIERLDGSYDEDEPASRASRDMLMTDAFLGLAAHLDSGILNPYFSNANQRKPKSDTDLVLVLDEALAGRKVEQRLSALAPQTASYSRLKQALAKAREELGTAVWPKVPKGRKKKIEPGDSDPSIPALRQRLIAEGLIDGPKLSRERAKAKADPDVRMQPSQPPEDFYGEDLVEGVILFQRKYGLKPDGVIGNRTLAMMNRDPQWRICQIRINLDRLRALKGKVNGGRYAVVNVPDFSLTIYEGGKPMHQMKVIVGMLSRKSPLMSDMIRFIVFSPKWHVPTSIAVKDKLPKIRKDPSFIRRHGMRVYSVGDTGIEEVDAESIDWESLSLGNFPYRIVQAAGDANALGRVKFMFPNRHAVYLHDTPTKYLFERGQRTYSSGCIRISDPIWFAKYLLKDKDGWDEDKIKASMRRSSPLTVNIDEHLPIHILYLTAWADENGEAVFRHDVYGFDAAAAKKFCDG